MSELPKVAGRVPVKVTLEAGKNYAYCTCGLSKTQPFCDGGHKGTGYTPAVFISETDQVVNWCTCKQSQSAPRCDGQHKCLNNNDT